MFFNTSNRQVEKGFQTTSRARSEMHLVVKRGKERKNGRNGKKDNWHFRTEGKKEGNRSATQHAARAPTAERQKASGERKRKLAAVNHTCNPSGCPVRVSQKVEFFNLLKWHLQFALLGRIVNKFHYLISVLPPDGLRGLGRRHGPWVHLPQQPGMRFQLGS